MGARHSVEARGITYGRVGYEKNVVNPGIGARTRRDHSDLQVILVRSRSGRRLSARGHERPRTRPRTHEAARARPKRRPWRGGPIFLRRRRIAKNRRVFIEGGEVVESEVAAASSSSSSSFVSFARN